MTCSPRLLLAAVTLSMLAGCPGDDPGLDNPPRLWLALDGSEVRVRLVPAEPFPY
jgi:hypothetical protein